VRVRHFDWELRYDADSYIGLLRTFSGHLVMTEEKQAYLYEVISPHVPTTRSADTGEPPSTLPTNDQPDNAARASSHRHDRTTGGKSGRFLPEPLRHRTRRSLLSTAR